MPAKQLILDKIRIDGGTQPRESLNEGVVTEYAEAMAAGVEFPAIVVYQDGADYWLADGFHRFHAARKASMDGILCDVRTGTRRDAVLHSVGANVAHGLRRSNADKRKAVQTLLADAEWSQWSDRMIAEACGVSHPFVASVRSVDAARRQDENRAKSAARQEAPRPPKVESDSTPAQAKVESDSTPAQEYDPSDDELNEARNTIIELAEENDRLKDRIAIEAWDVSEEDKLDAHQIIEQLREENKNLQIELNAVKSSRDAYQNENAQMKRQIKAQRNEIDRLNKQIAGAA